jgi:short-subunit dehydrogenase
VGNRDGMYIFAEKVINEFGKIDILINNAGVALVSNIDEMSYHDFEHVMNINFWGMVYGSKAFLPYLKQRKKSQIVNISSVFGLWALPSQAAYNSSKFAIRGFTESLSQELYHTGVNVMCVHPGGIKTEIVKNAGFATETSLLKNKNRMEKLFAFAAITKPQKAAKIIIKGIKKEKRRLLVGTDAYLFDLSQRMFPSLYQKIIPFFESLVPKNFL